MSASSLDIKRLVLGGAQFGLDYGITNSYGRIGTGEAALILATASQLGVSQIDTAQSYGTSEAALGAALHALPQSAFRVVTKLSPLAELDEGALTAEVWAAVDASLIASGDKLGRAPLDAVLMHRASHFTAWEGAAWNRLLEWRNAGRIVRLGVSVQNVAELELALRNHDVSIVQLPCNLLDWRWQPLLARLRAARRDHGLEVHVRSVLLQGLLTSDEPTLWRRAHVADNRPITCWLRARAAEFSGGNLARLCINYVRGLDWVDGVVVGVANLEQLVDNTDFFSGPALRPAALEAIEADCPKVAELTLDPARWR